MSSLLKSLPINDPQILIEVITKVIDEIQSGAIVLDTSLGNEEFGYIDLVAADKNKTGMFFFINLSGREVEFIRFLKCLQWYHENRPTIQKLYTGIIDLSLSPCIFFISPYYSPAMQKVLLHLIREDHIVLLKYTCFQDGEEFKIFLEKIVDSLISKNKTDTQTISKNKTKTAPPTRKPSPQPQKEQLTSDEQPPGIDLERFRQEIKFDISNISDEELLDLLE